MPKISIIMSVYNTAAYLHQSVSSIMGQRFKDFELIIIDDGSTDGSSAICDELAAQDERIRVVHKINSGQADSRNIAIKMATGNYVGFVDSDDWIEPDMYEFLYEQAQSSNADAAVCSYWEEYKNCSKERVNDHVGVFSHDEAYRIYFFCQNVTTYLLWPMLIKRRLLIKEIPQLRFCEDTAVVLDWISGAEKVVITNKSLYHYRMRKSSVMHIDRQVQRAYINLDIIHNRSLAARKCGVISKKEIDSYDAESYLYIAQHFVRDSKNADNRKALAVYASRYLNEIWPVDLSGKRRKVRKRIQLLLSHPSRFAWQMWLSGFLSFKKDNQNKGYTFFD